MPKYLLASEIVDKVMPPEDSDPGDEQPSPEEIDYLLGGYDDPQYERNGR